MIELSTNQKTNKRHKITKKPGRNVGLNVTWSVNAVVIMIVIVLAARGTPECVRERPKSRFAAV